MKDTDELEREVELPRVKDFMAQPLHTVAADTPLDEVLHFFLKRKSENIPLVVVGAEKGEFVGIITERECIEYLSNEIFYGNSETTAKGLLSKVPLCVSPDTDIFTVCHIFIKHPCRYLPVVRKKILEGITSRPQCGAR